MDDEDAEDLQPDYAGLFERTRTQRDLKDVPRRGPKDDIIEGGALQHALTAYYNVLEETVNVQRHTAEGERTASSGLVRVLVHRGPQLHSMGIRNGGETVLQPEEALFLLERGSLIVRRGCEVEGNREVDDGTMKERIKVEGPTYSVQEGYASLLDRELCTFEQFQTYAHLKRFGFRLRRCCCATSEQSQPSIPTQEGLIRRFFRRIRHLFSIHERIKAFRIGLYHRLRDMQYPTLKAFRMLQITQHGSRPQPANLGTQPTLPASGCLEVFKPSTPFAVSKKRHDGVFPKPDFHVLFHETDSESGSWTFLPSLLRTMDAFKNSTETRKENIEPSKRVDTGKMASQNTKRLKEKETPENDRMLFAIVNGGDVSFLSLEETRLECIVEGFHG